MNIQFLRKRDRKDLVSFIYAVKSYSKDDILIDIQNNNMN